MRVYRLSKIGPRLPRTYRYGPAEKADDCRPGFQAYKNLPSLIANSIGAIELSTDSAHMTQAEGYNLVLMIDVRSARNDEWNFRSQVVVSLQDVKNVRSLAVGDLHAWLRDQPACLSTDAQLNRDAVITWVTDNRGMVESWMDLHSEQQPVEFTETLEPMQSPSE